MKKLLQEVMDAPSINAFKKMLDRHWRKYERLNMSVFSRLATWIINLKY